MSDDLDADPIPPSSPSLSAEFGPDLSCTCGSFATKRRWPRFAVDIPVQVGVTTQGPTRVIACVGQGTDISAGGLAVNAEIELTLGAQIGVEFTPPYSDQPIAFRCFVRNRDGNRYGVEFITENDEDYQKQGELQTGLAAMNAAKHA
jgi:hypothetical protein